MEGIHSILVGYLAVAVSAFFFGTYGVFTKTRALRDHAVDPILVQCFMSFVIFVSSWLVALYTQSFHFTYLGILSALLWVPASILATTAIRLAGLGISQGVWSGVTIVVSFIWGAVIFHDSPVHSVGLKVLGVAVLVLGIFGVATTIREEKKEEDMEPLINESRPKSKHRALLGLVCAVILGCFNGCMLVPMKYVPPQSSGIGFAMSFGVGVLIVTAVMAPAYYLIVRPKDMPTWHKVKVGALPSCLAGVFWNVGNIASVVAAQSALGLTLGFPLTQCALLVAALWGFFVYHEISGTWRTIQLFVSALVLLGGATMMSLLG